MIVTLDDWCGIKSGRYDDTGVQWIITKITGWYDSPPMRTSFDARPQQPGNFDAPVYADARVITLEGRIGVDLRTQTDALTTARAATQGLLANGERGTLTIDRDGQRLQADVRLSDATTCEPLGPLAYEFSIQLTAPDPVRYAATERQVSAPIFTDPAGGLTFPLRFDPSLRFNTGTGHDGRLAMPNPGTAPTWPIFRINGPATGLVQQRAVLTAPNGDRLVYRDNLAAGEYLVINTARKQVLLQGVSSRRYRMAEAQFEGFQIPPGSESVVVFSTEDYPNPDSNATARWRPAYW